jgi:hypothetical protein
MSRKLSVPAEKVPAGVWAGFARCRFACFSGLLIHAWVGRKAMNFAFLRFLPGDGDDGNFLI